MSGTSNNLSNLRLVDVSFSGTLKSYYSFQDAKITVDNILYVVEGRINIFCKFYVKVSKFHYYRVVTEQFWASLKGVEKVTFVTEKELNRVLGKDKKETKKSRDKNKMLVMLSLLLIILSLIIFKMFFL